jgi:endo-1,4-beta-D-glucanase Y
MVVVVMMMMMMMILSDKAEVLNRWMEYFQNQYGMKGKFVDVSTVHRNI